MKVVLIYAKSQVIRQKAAEVFADESVTKGELARDEIYPPLGISILGAGLEQLGHQVRLLDDSIEEIETVREAMQWSDLVGISALTPNARRARELGKIAREEYSKPVVMGGPHPTTNPDSELAADWRDGGYPYKNLMSRRSYERQKYRLQVELLKLQAWVKESGQRVLILFEGRDAAGKGIRPSNRRTAKHIAA
jgi:hypothetical protein